ncbi:HAD-IIIA family hydrolase [Candidatus Hecatella orcuttiae]|uniref:HAD family hydrolase n=1 Tax=Candidatus Hecatella orcuttiae TaxID=1935119 RepID=UPI002867E155|nr:HAD-IIIA family hydrolase [Candidatus Hecatella orcuttiae]
MIKAVCLDLGDTLIDEESVVREPDGRALSGSPVQGAFQLLKALKEKGYRLALVCNGDSVGTRRVMASSGLTNSFDVVVISGDVGIEKPDPRIFQIALERLGVKPEEAVMVGNRVDADVVGAKRAGMRSILFKWNNRYPDSIDSEEKKPDFTVRSLDEVLKIIEEIGEKG